MRNDNWRWMGAALALGLIISEADADSHPNIILVLADDLGIGDLGVYNPESRIPTPHADRLAAEGMRLTDAHSPSAVCTPTRYGLLTGRYAWRTRLTQGVLLGRSPNLIEPERLTLPELLRSVGYRTAAIGKWHLGLGSGEETDYEAPLRPGPLDHGFDEFFGIPASLDMEPYVYVIDDHPVQPATEKIAASRHRRQNGSGYWRAGEIAPDFRHIDVFPKITARAVEFIECAHRDQPDRPFFLYFALTAPHTPWLPTETYTGRSGAGHYGDFVCQVDDTLGAVLEALDRLDIADETLLVFTSDNGSHWPEDDIERWGHDANLGFRGQKADIWEGGHRVPFIVRWPGVVPPGTVRDDLACLTDLFATCASVVGAALPDDAAEDSFDLSPVLHNRILDQPVRQTVVHHSLRGTFAIRSGRWKLCLSLGSGGFTQPAHEEPPMDGPLGQLYDLKSDPTETTSLWLREPELVAELSALLSQYRRAGRTRPLAGAK